MLVLLLVSFCFWAYTMYYVVNAVLRYYWNCYRHPPGPWGVPCFGILLQLICQGGEDFQKRTLANKMGRKYAQNSGVFSYMLGTRRFVFLHSYEAIKEAFSDYATQFSGRPQEHLKQWFGRAVGGIVLTEGHLWRVMRRFASRLLRNFGKEPTLLEESLHAEAKALNERVRRNVKHRMQPDEVFVRGVSNVISQLVFGARWEDDDPEYDAYIRCVRTGLQSGGLLNALRFLYPRIASWGIFKYILSKADALAKNDQCLEEFVGRRFAQVEARYKLNADDKGPRCFVEAYLQEMAEGGKNVPSEEWDTRYQGVRSCLDLFVAGTDTTSTLLSWTMLYLAINPDVQEKLHAEIDQQWKQSHNNNLPSEENLEPRSLHIRNNQRDAMPYTQAVMDETQRLSSIVFHGVMHCVEKSCQFRGYQLDREDIIFPNLHHVHHDENLWGADVEQFRPERFLMEDPISGEVVYRPSNYLIPFGMGRRACLGENLAKMEYFTFLANIMAEFRVELTPESRMNLKEILRGTEGIISAPKSYSVYFESRV